MHPRSCRCGECDLVAKEEAKAGREIFHFFNLGNYRRSFREVNRLWVAAVKEEKWETIDPGHSQHLETTWHGAPDVAKTRIKEMCDVVLS